MFVFALNGFLTIKNISKFNRLKPYMYATTPAKAQLLKNKDFYKKQIKWKILLIVFKNCNGFYWSGPYFWLPEKYKKI